MTDLLKYIIKGITDSDDFEVSESQEEDFTVYTIKASKDIIGMIIGKEGKTIKAIRQILTIRATIDQVRFRLNVEEK